MGKVRGDLDLAKETLGAQGVGQLGTQDFDGDLTTVFPVLCYGTSAGISRIIRARRAPHSNRL